MQSKGKSSRYASDLFKQRQRETFDDRQAILTTLGLDTNSGYQNWIEMPTKLVTDANRNHPKVRAVEKLKIVHPINRTGTPIEVLHKARGTIIYVDSDYNTKVLRKSIPYSKTVTMKSLKVTESGTILIRDVNSDGSYSDIETDDYIINEYTNGSVIDIMLSNGELLFVTSRNLLADGGATHEDDKPIYKKAAIESYLTPFIDSFRAILKASGNEQILDKETMFGDALYSPYIYRFILVTPERAGECATYINQIGYLIYLGPQKQWDYKNVDESFYDVEHSVYEGMNTVQSEPEDRDTPYILYRQEGGLNVDDANAILRGDPKVDFRFSGGGKLVITGRNVKGNDFLSHVQSPSYKYRGDVLGDATNIYDGFVTSLSINKYDLAIPESISMYIEKYPNIAIPPIKDIYTTCGNFGDLPTPEFRQELVTYTPIRTMWYVYLLCTNASLRYKVCRFLKRYIADRTAVLESTWFTVGIIVSSKPNASKKKFSVKSLEKSRAIRDAEKGHRDDTFMITTVEEIRRSQAYRNGGDEQGFLYLPGDKACRLISIYRKKTGTKRESILISEPGATFYDVEAD